MADFVAEISEYDGERVDGMFDAPFVFALFGAGYTPGIGVR
jgi:hypothetical protein